MSRPKRLLYALCSSSATTGGSLIRGSFHPRCFSAGNVARATAGANIDKDPWWKESMEKVRNIGISAHINSGKTTLTERILFHTSQIHKMHKVRGRDGCGAMDIMDLERVKGITIKSASTYCNWKGSKINIIDTPGHADFAIEVERALRVIDGAVLLLCSVGGVQSQSITFDRLMTRYQVPRIAFINKLDQMGADPWKVLNQTRSKLRHHTAAIQVPIGLENEFTGLIDLVKLKAYYFEGSHGKDVVVKQMPSNMEALVADKRRELIETVSEVDDILAKAFLNDETISEVDLEGAIRRATIARKFIPVFMGSAVKNKGVQPLLDGALSYLPCPIEVRNYAIDQSKNEEEKVELTGSPDAPLVALAFKSEQTKLGHLTYLRIFDGVIRKGGFIFNVNKGKNIKISRLIQMHSHEMHAIQEALPGQIIQMQSHKMHGIQEAHAGQIVAVFVPEYALGDTFTDGLVNYTMTSIAIPEPVMSLAIRPVLQKYEENLSDALNYFQTDDPTFRVGLDPESGQTIISGMGEMHLQIYLERILMECHIATSVGKPRVNSRETITQRATFDYLHKKQSGGQEEYARVIGYIEPLPEAKFEFLNMVVGEAIPSNFMAAIEEGFKEAANSGALIGRPVENLRVVLTDGAAHAVDSSELAFKVASMCAFKQCYEASKPVILEPIMLVELKVPTEFQGAVAGDLNKRKGVIVGNDQDGDDSIIRAHVPLSNISGYSTVLRSMTQGKGEFTMEYKEHLPVSHDVQTLLVNFKKIDVSSYLGSCY